MIDLVTPEEAKREAAKGLKEAIAVSIKKFECFLPLKVADLGYDFCGGSDKTCGLCQDKKLHKTTCGVCVLYRADEDCGDENSQYQIWIESILDIEDGRVTTITQFRKETRKMIKILKQLYKECK